MDFEAIVNAIKDFMNQPIPIIACSVGSLLTFVLTIISKTTIGKKSLNLLKKGYAELETKYTNIKDKTFSTYDELEKLYTEKINIMQSEYNALCEFLIVIAENTNNVKVKKALIDFKEKVNLKAKDYQGYVEKAINDAKTHFEKEIVEKYETALLDYKKQFDELLLETKEKVEGDTENGEKTSE